MPRNKTMGRNANGNGSIRKVSSNIGGKTYTYWQGRYTEGYDPITGKQIQRSITGKTQKEVAQKLKDLTYELEHDLYFTPCKMTLEEWIDIWKTNYTDDVKPSTAYLYKKNLNLYVLPNIGQLKLSDLNGITIQRFYNVLSHPKAEEIRPLSAKSVKNVHGILHKVLQQAVALGYLRDNPTEKCILPKIIRREGTPLDEKALPFFLSAIEEHPHEYLYKIALYTGIREGEILGLTWDCIDFKEKTLTIKQQLRKEQKKGGAYYFSPPKNGKSRTLVLPNAVLDLFYLQKKKQEQQMFDAGSLWKNRGLIFSNQIGDFLSYRTVYDCFKRVVAKIGYPEIRFHDLRHSYAVIAIKNGDDPKTVQGNLGHATAAFTLDVYTHVTSGMKQASADRMDRFISGMCTDFNDK